MDAGGWPHAGGGARGGGTPPRKQKINLMGLSMYDEKKIANMFNTIAPRYDFLNHLLSLRQDYRWRRKLATLIPDQPNLKLLDVATGTGDVIAACRQGKQYPPHCTGIDIAAEMLTLARHKLNPTTKLLQMSATSLSFPDNSFDAITIAFGLRNINNKQKALQEFQRTLKQNGQLLILEFFNPKNKLLSPFTNFYLHHLLPRIAALFSNKEAYQYLPRSIASFYSTEELNQLAQTCNLQQTKHIFFLGGTVGLLQFHQKDKQP